MATKKETKVIEEGQQVLFVQQEQIVNPLQDVVNQLKNKIVGLEQQLIFKTNNVEQLELQVKDLTKTRDGLTQQIFDRDKQKVKEDQEHHAVVESLRKQLELQQKETSALTQKFNSMASLFDEYIKGTDDMVELSKLFLRNNLRTQELLQNKIKAFNGEGAK